jgi:dipeptidyl aminopeptidase/acylaminoacyl peptidase
MKKTGGLLLLFAGIGICVSGVAAQDAKQQKPSPQHTKSSSAHDPLRSLFHVQGFDEVAISPDGKQVAWVERKMDEGGGATGESSIYVSEYTKASPAKRITAGTGGFFSERGIAWSPDSKSVAFLSDAAKKGQLQLYVTTLAEGSARKLTNAKGLLMLPKWSPDGKSIAVLYTENATREAGPLVAETAETGVIKDAIYEQRLAIVDMRGGALRSITPEDTYIYEYDWAPDSKTLVAIAAKGNGDNNWWIAQLYRVNVGTKDMRSIYKPQLQISRPVVSPDGENVAFIEGLMSDEDSVGGDVFLLSIEGGTPRNLTPKRKASASLLAWTSDGRIVDMEDAEGDSSVVQIDPNSGAIDLLYRAPELLTNGYWATSLSLTTTGAVSACVRSSYTNAPEVWAGPIGKWTQVTRHNTTLKPDWGEAKSVRWKSDGLDVQGWLIYPKEFDASKKYPMVVAVHGGPSLAVQSSWPTGGSYFMSLPAKGYFVFRPNPRGSFGQGEEFTRANVKDFGYGDWRDILAGVDYVLANAPVDSQRLGLTGWSYGGYMTMWGVTQSDRFRAAVAGAGITDWASYYGENKIDQWMIPFFGKSVYDDPEWKRNLWCTSMKGTCL